MRGWWIAVALWVGMGSVAVAQPHLDYQTQTKTATVTGESTDTALWTPLTGSRFALQGCAFASSTAADVQLEVSDVDVVPPIYLESYGMKMIGGVGAPIYTSATDDVLRYTVEFTDHTNSGTTRLSIMCWGYEYQQ